MSAGKLREPGVITDFRQRHVCMLPVGFYFNDERWEKISDRFEH
jgi:exopolysaccharide biosynthesis predicted pyruvyltransferase EpsI